MATSKGRVQSEEKLEKPQPPAAPAGPAAFGRPVFVEAGKPIAFYVPPCQGGAELRTLVRHGGGLIVNKPSEKAINIIPEGAQLAERSAVSSRYIIDSMDKGVLQKSQDYIIPPSKGGGASAGGKDTGAKPLVALAPPGAREEVKAKAERMKFTAEDEAALARWVRANPGLKAKGRELWERAQRAKITKHTWQSMQNHYRRKLCDNKAAKPGALAVALAKEAAAKPVEPVEPERPKPEKKRPRPADAKPNSSGWPKDELSEVPEWLRETQKTRRSMPDLSDL